IGYLVTRYRTILESPNVFAGILMILLLSVMFDVLARAIERHTLVWQTAGRREKAKSREDASALPSPAAA
ncbi:MAG: ABC transporter permease, partial [Variibacter sp.]|nr:ABC transporter permease [Variibacter sp.]